jgi:phosphoglycerate dehydrogenase-like enzyme
MKSGVHLVNIARGTLVDQEALRVALEDGRVARASLDVVDPEPLPEGHWLYSHPRVRLSPHVSWSAPGTIERTIELFVDNLRRWREGRPLHGAVDPVAGY